MTLHEIMSIDGDCCRECFELLGDVHKVGCTLSNWKDTEVREQECEVIPAPCPVCGGRVVNRKCTHPDCDYRMEIHE